jgi:hypothetical protein
VEVGDALEAAGHAPHLVRRRLDLDRLEHAQHRVARVDAAPRAPVG